ncbi:MAG: hypothetical protein MZV49_25500 [Rhodopseudomonas palustris]|nr:hypothetical protein [Rhodopseudomonas palustris]
MTYDGKNGHPYTSVGAVSDRRGLVSGGSNVVAGAEGLAARERCARYRGDAAEQVNMSLSRVDGRGGGFGARGDGDPAVGSSQSRGRYAVSCARHAGLCGGADADCMRGATRVSTG